MKNALILTLALLGFAAQTTWAGSQSSNPAPPSHPPLQCACVIGGPAA